MKTLLKTVALAVVLAPFAAQPARAQGPTPEGTVITNTATASWTDANGNAYTPVSASVGVTVGFQAGLDVTSSATATPASPSTGNELPFAVANTGNGTDSVSISISVGAGVTVTGYRVGATTYASLADLNAALAGTGTAAGGSITVTVIYDVASGQGGQNISITLTATSRRSGATSDASSTSVNPPVSGGVTVDADASTESRLPSNGTQYSTTFTVTNTGSAADDFTLTGSSSNGAVLSIVSVNGTSGSTGTLAGLAAGASQTVTVVYTIASDASAGASANLQLTATSSNNASVNDSGTVGVTVIRATVSITKRAFRDDQTTELTSSDVVLPGEYIQYRISVTNTGAASASTVSVSDALPSQVTYVSAAGDAAGWSFSQSSGTVTASLTGSLSGGGASRYFWIRVRVN